MWTRVEWTEGALRYQQSNQPISGSDPERMPLETDIRMRPPPAAWRTFWACAEDTQVWTWAERYENQGLLDGHNWEVTIRRGNKHAESSGYSAYPADDDPQRVVTPSPSERFRALMQAAEALIERRSLTIR